MSEDKCRPVVVDGEVVRVRGGRAMNAQEVDAGTDYSKVKYSSTFDMAQMLRDGHTCERVFTTIQGAVTHRRRAHEGFNPHAKVAS